MARQTLTARQLAAINALLTSPSLSEACRVSGVPIRTLTTWLRTPLFVEALNEAQRLMLSQIVAQLTAHAGAAVEVLAQEMRNAEAYSGERTSAAAKLLKQLRSIREHFELDQRLRALEAAVHAKQDSGDREDLGAA